MNLLTEVDQPGSAIDQYVNRLDKILKQKLEGVAMLQVWGAGHVVVGWCGRVQEYRAAKV
eukprot:347417-Chlamydomonas_euryale.AAC.4